MAGRISLNALAARALAGDTAVWRQLVERLYPWALRLARRRLPHGVAPEDAVQESFLIAYAKLDQLREPAAFPAWLASIIVSQCARLGVSGFAEVSLDQLELCGLLPPMQGGDPEDALCTMQLLAACDAAIEELPGHLRDVCRLHYRRGLSVPEAALACCLPEGTVKKRLFTARPLLQARLSRFHCETIFRVGYMPISDHLLAMCADHLSQGRGLPLCSKRYLSWAALAGDLRRGRLDAAFIMAPLALSLRQAGTPLVYVMDGHHDGSSLSLSKHAARRWRMGLPGECSTHRVLLHRLVQERPELSELPTMVVNPSSTISSLRQNVIGSFFCGEPWSAKCAHEGLGETLLRSRDISPGHLCCILAVREEFAQRQGQVLTDYVRLLLAARDRVRRDTAFAASVQAAYSSIEADVARKVLDERIISFDDLDPEQGRLDTFAHLARQAGVLPESCCASGFARTEFFAQASA
ncbi:MAG: sigma-70 family RNA polymerase sigma factor [Proteobacteria bacterium]|nr:sigma-70 family RNA polymerase sigma factor [Pseudomonadota bacterium]